MTMVVLASVLAMACGTTPTPASTTPAPSAAPAVDVAPVVSDTLKIIVPLPGELRPYESVPIFSKVGGFVKSIDVDRGSRVTKDQVIARLEAPELLSQRAEADAKLQTAQAQLAAAQAKLSSDDSTYQRLKAASATAGVVSGNELDVSARVVEGDRAEVKAQQEIVSAATEARQSTAALAAYLDVKAPFAGVVTERNVHPGALVGPAGAAGGADPIVRIETWAELRLIVPVPEAYVAGIGTAKTVEFTVSAYPGRTFTGSIARIAHAVDVKTRTMPVELAVSNGSGDLSSGSFCSVRWPVERHSPTLFVPTTAVASTLERTFVVRIRDGKADWVDVRTGVTSGKLVEVFGALQAGDQVAVRGTDEVKPGAAVTTRVQK